MTTLVLDKAVDAWTDQANPTKRQPATPRLHVLDSTNDKNSWIYFGLPFPIGATVIKAELWLFGANASTGSTTLTARLPNKKWRQNYINWSGQPTSMTGPTATLVQGATAIKGKWAIDVTALMQSVSSGTPWYGFRVTQNTANLLMFYAADHPEADYRPQLYIEWLEVSEEPENLRPNDGLAISVSKPVLLYEWNDPDGDDLIAQQVRLYQNEADALAHTNIYYESGEVGTTIPQFDLGEIVDLTPAAAGNAGTFDTDINNWLTSNCTLARVTTPTRDGAGALRMTASAAGNMFAASSNSTSIMTPVIPGRTYWVRGFTRTDTTPRSARVEIQWYDSAGVSISTTQGPDSTNTTSYLGREVTAVAPATAAYMRIRGFITGAAAGEIHYWDTFTTYQGTGANPSVADGSSLWWRVRAKDVGNTWSPWSDPANYTRWVKNTLTITTTQIGTPSPTVSWTFTGQRSQTKYRVTVYKANNLKTVLWDSGWTPGTATSRQIPYGIIEPDVSYRITVQVLDEISRESLPGDPAYSTDSITETIVFDGAVSDGSGLSVTSDPLMPIATLQWTRPSAPNGGFAILRSEDNGATWEFIDEVDAAEVFVSGTTYQYKDSGASPYKSIQWRVCAIVNGQMGNGMIVNGTVRRLAPFLYRKDGVDAVCFLNPERSMRWTDVVGVHEPMSGESVVVTQRMGKMAGTISGRLSGDSIPGVSADQMLERFERLRENTGERMYVAIANRTFEAYAFNFQYDILTDASGITYQASVEWREAPKKKDD